MKQTIATFLSFSTNWVLAIAIAFGPLKAAAQSEAVQLSLPFEDQLRLPFDEPNNGIKVVKATDQEDLSKLASADPTEINRPDLKEKVGAQAFYDSNSTTQERKNTSPKAILAAWNTAKASPKIAGQTLMSFPAEASVFYTAMGLLAAVELNHPLTSKNPAALEQFFHHSFKDPVGAVGFYGFMLVNRQTSHFFEQLRMLGGTDIKDMTRVKRIFYGHVAPQIGMSAGFLAQTVFTELWHDKEFKMCVGRFGLKKINKIVGGKKVALAPDSPEILEACEQAYDRWAVRQKIKDYVPLIAAMVVTNILQMSSIPFAKWLVNDTKAGKTIVSKVMQTKGIGAILGRMSLAIRVGKNFVAPQGGLVVRILSMVAFIKGSELVQPTFDRLTGMPLKADDIADMTNRFEQKITEAVNSKWQPVNYVDREDQRKNDPAELLKKLGMQFQKMRQFHLQIPYANHANWQQALAKFQGAYTSSYAMYDRVIDEVREFRGRESKNRYIGENPSALFLSRESPMYRVGTLIAKKQSGPLANDPLRELLVRIRDYYAQNLKSLTPAQEKVLRQINFGLEAAYRDLSAAELDAAVKKANLNSANLTAEQRNSIAYEIRANRVSTALKLFSQVGNNVRNGSGVGFKITSGFKGLFNEIAGDVNKMDFNAFMYHLHSNVKAIDVAVTTAGYDYYHRELGTNKNIVSELARESTPKRYQRAYTPTMADYLLASMVCGPRAQGGAAERSAQTTLVSKALNWWNYDKNDGGASTVKAFEKLSLIEFTPGFGWRFLPPRLVVDSLADANLCDSIPKRSKLHNVSTAAEEFISGRSVEKQNISLLTYFNVNSGEFKVNNEVHHGMLPLVKKFVRPEFLATANGEEKPFHKYWVANVEPQAKKALVEFHKGYRELVSKDFAPRFASGEYLNVKGRKVHYGTGWSIRDEGMYYRDFLKRMIPTPEMESLLNTYQRNLLLSIGLFSKPEQVRKATDVILKTIKEESVEKSEEQKESEDFLADLAEVDDVKIEFTAEQIAQVKTAGDPAAQLATIRLLKAIAKNMTEIKELVAKTSLKGTAKNVAEQLLVNMEQVVGETETYNGVIRAVNLQGLPEVADLL